MFMSTIKRKKYAITGAIIGAFLLSTLSMLVDIVAQIFGII